MFNNCHVEIANPWTREEMRSLKRYILVYGYNRWSKLRAVSRSNCKLLSKKPDDEIRCYANAFLFNLARNVPHDSKDLAENLARVMDVKEEDFIIQSSISDFADNLEY
jgi:hypothetical protein